MARTDADDDDEEIGRRLRALEQRQEQQAVRHDELHARVRVLEGEHGMQSVLAYAIRHGLPTHRSYLARVGRRATAIARALGQVPGTREDARYGTVNVYTQDILQKAFKEVTH